MALQDASVLRNAADLAPGYTNEDPPQTLDVLFATCYMLATNKLYIGDFVFPKGPTWSLAMLEAWKLELESYNFVVTLTENVANYFMTVDWT